MNTVSAAPWLSVLCTYCSHYVTQYFYCQQGHIICLRCKIQFPSCLDYAGNNVHFRNLCLERHACLYRNLGCSAVLSYNDILLHYSRCDYRPHTCNILTQGIICAFAGPLNLLKSHIREQHQNAIIEQLRDCVYIRLLEVEPGSEWYLIVIYLDEFFLCIFKADENEIMGHVKYIGRYENARKYIQVITLLDAEGEEKESFEAVVSSNVPDGQIGRSEYCCLITFEDAQNVMDGERRLFLKLQIQKGNEFSLLQPPDDASPFASLTENLAHNAADESNAEAYSNSEEPAASSAVSYRDIHSSDTCSGIGEDIVQNSSTVADEPDLEMSSTSEAARSFISAPFKDLYPARAKIFTLWQNSAQSSCYVVDESNAEIPTTLTVPGSFALASYESFYPTVSGTGVGEATAQNYCSVADESSASQRSASARTSKKHYRRKTAKSANSNAQVAESNCQNGVTSYGTKATGTSTQPAKKLQRYKRSEFRAPPEKDSWNIPESQSPQAQPVRAKDPRKTVTILSRKGAYATTQYGCRTSGWSRRAKPKTGNSSTPPDQTPSSMLASRSKDTTKPGVADKELDGALVEDAQASSTKPKSILSQNQGRKRLSTDCDAQANKRVTWATPSSSDTSEDVYLCSNIKDALTQIMKKPEDADNSSTSKDASAQITKKSEDLENASPLLMKKPKPPVASQYEDCEMSATEETSRAAEQKEAENPGKRVKKWHPKQRRH